MRIRFLLFSLLLSAVVLMTGCDSGSTVPDDVGDNTAVAFTESSAEVGEDAGTVTVDVVVNDPGFKEFSVTVAVDEEQSTATLGEDVTGLSGSQTLTFSQETTGGETQTVSFEVVDDDELLEGDETLVLTVTGGEGAGAGETATFTLTIEENDTILTIAESRDLSNGDRVVTEGIVTRNRGNGVFIQDDTGGLFVFGSDFAASVSMGDEVRVDGTRDSFNGLAQVSDVSGSSITETLSTGNPLPDPQLITLDEVTSNGDDYESELIRVEGFSIDSKGDQTFQAGGGAGNYPITSGGTESTLRIPSGSELEGTDIPSQANFQGVLGQFSSADPPMGGYQLLGILRSDLEPVFFATGFDDDQLSPMQAYSVASSADWGTNSTNASNSPFAEANAFGSDEPADDWLITPAFDFTQFDGETLTFLSAKEFDDGGLEQPLTVLVSTNYSGSGDPTTANWTNVTDRATLSPGDNEFVASGDVDLSDAAFQDASVYVAFRYRSSDTGPGTTERWRIDNINLRAVGASQ